MGRLTTNYIKSESSQEITEIQEQFIKRALASEDKAKKKGKYFTHEEVMAELEKILAKATKNNIT